MKPPKPVFSVDASLREIPITGKICIRQPVHDFFAIDGGEDFCSAVMDSPPWHELLAVLEKQIQVTRDYHHVFLEGISIIGIGETGVKICQFIMGS